MTRSACSASRSCFDRRRGAVIAKRGGKAAPGLLMERELKFLGAELEKPRHVHSW